MVISFFVILSKLYQTEIICFNKMDLNKYHLESHNTVLKWLYKPSTQQLLQYLQYLQPQSTMRNKN